MDLFKPEARRDENVKRLARLQTVLRTALRRGIEDPDFRTLFDSDETVRGHWPVEVRQRLWRWRRERL